MGTTWSSPIGWRRRQARTDRQFARQDRGLRSRPARNWHCRESTVVEVAAAVWRGEALRRRTSAGHTRPRQLHGMVSSTSLAAAGPSAASIAVRSAVPATSQSSFWRGKARRRTSRPSSAAISCASSWYASLSVDMQMKLPIRNVFGSKTSTSRRRRRDKIYALTFDGLYVLKERRVREAQPSQFQAIQRRTRKPAISSGRLYVRSLKFLSHRQ